MWFDRPTRSPASRSRRTRPTSATRSPVPGCRSGSARCAAPAARGCSRWATGRCGQTRDMLTAFTCRDRSGRRLSPPATRRSPWRSRRWLRRSRRCGGLRRRCTAGRAARDRGDEVLDQPLVTTDIGYDRRRGAAIRIGLDFRQQAVDRRPHVGGDHPVVLQDDGSFGRRQLHSPRVPGIGGRRRFERRANAAVELEDGQRRVLDFDLVQQRRRGAQHAAHRAEQPHQEIDRVDALVDQRAAAVERTGAAPAGAGVVLGRAVPLDPRRGEQRASERARPQQLPKPDERRLRAVLEQHAETHARCAAPRRSSRSAAATVTSIGFSTSTCSPAAAAAMPWSACTPDGLPMITASSGRWASKRRQFVVRHTTVQLGQPRRAGVVGAVHRDDLDAGNLATGARVRLADVAGADQCDVRHGRIMHHRAAIVHSSCDQSTVAVACRRRCARRQCAAATWARAHQAAGPDSRAPQ